MPSTVYKGDISEVTMGHESGIYIESGQPCTWTVANASLSNHSTITFAGTGHNNDNTIFQNALPILKVPTGMLVGCKFSFHGTAGNFAAFDYSGARSQVYTIIDHVVVDASPDATVLSVSPKIGSAASLGSAAADIMYIHSIGTPAIDTSFAHTVAATTAKEMSLTDQFIGLASYVSLPDTQVELKRYHVVGMGRQVSVQQTGKVSHQGGAIEMPLHDPKWLYYCLGREVVDAVGLIANYASQGDIKSGKTISPGQTYVDIVKTDFTDGATITGGVKVGDYIMVHDVSRAPVVHHKHADEGSTDWWPPASSTSLASDSHHFEATETSEIRRVVAMEALTGHATNDFRLFVDEAWQFTHVETDLLYAFRFATADATGSPDIASTGVVTNPVRRLLFSGDTIPSFALEHSIRTRDVGSHTTETGVSNAPGSSTDSKQLTRVFKGCKITEWELSTTPDDEVKFRAIFDALSCYTDTGRLAASTPGDRYHAHRMFQNMAETTVNRKKAGIAPNAQKPYMFYNSTINMFNQSIAQISHFELRGKTGVEFFHTIQGNPVVNTVNSDGHTTKQIPHGGTRNPSIVREGREEFEMEIDVIIGDPLLWHELRTSRDFTGTAGDTGSIIDIFMSKPISGAGQQQTMRIIIDDYIITEAPIPVPDDKGLLHSKIKVLPKTVKIISQDSLFHC